MTCDIASLLVKEPTVYSGLSFFDLPRASYGALVDGMADEHMWHFEKNTTDTHMDFLRKWGPRMVEWSAQLPFPKGSVHLDIGAGEGILSYLVARRGYHSIAVELSATILHSATLFQAAVNRSQFNEHASMNLWVADIFDLPLKSLSVDFVTIKQVLHHLDHLDGLLREVARVLKPDGVVYIWEPFYISIPLLRQYFLKRTKAYELPRGIHHFHHSYWTYQRLFNRWLTEVNIRRIYRTGKLRYYFTRNCFTVGEVYAWGRIKPQEEVAREPSERIRIQPKDFLREDLLAEGLRTTECRREFLDSLLTPQPAPNRTWSGGPLSASMT